MTRKKPVMRIGYNPQAGMTLEECVQSNNRLVHSVCQRYLAKAKANNVDYDDMSSMGFIGLMKAYDKFDPASYQGTTGKGVKFSTYAVPKIIGEIQRFFREHDQGAKFSRVDKETGNKIAYLENQERGFMSRPLEEIAELLEVSVEVAKSGLNYLKNRTADSIHAVVFENDGDPITREDQVATNEDYTTANVEEFLNKLPKQYRIIIELRMLGKTQAEIGEVIKRSQVQVSRIMEKIEEITTCWMSGKPIDWLLGYEEGEEIPEIATAQRKPKKRGPKLKGDHALALKLIREGELPLNEIARRTDFTSKTIGRWAKLEREGQPLPKKYHRRVKEEGSQWKNPGNVAIAEVAASLQVIA